VTDRPPRPPRAEPREIAELRQLKDAQPELAAAVDMQIALLEMQRRVQARVPLPWISLEPEQLVALQAAGGRLVRFGDIPLDWTDFRLTFRQTADILRRFDALEPEDYEQLMGLVREGNQIESIVERWYEATSGAVGADAAGRAPDGLPASLDQVLVLALRPFLARSAEVLAQRVDVSGWNRGHCPFCGWEPDFAVITPGGDRRLVCGRCTAQWTFGSLTCPYCANDDLARITSFATRDGRYRVYGCDVCHRYLKAYDARNASRPAMVGVDTIATLPLDAAAIQRGYSG